MEQPLKQRLVGAVVLVSLAVIFIPIILEGPDEEPLSRDHTIPEPPEVDYRAEMELSLPAAQPEPEAAPVAVPATPEPEPVPPIQPMQREQPESVAVVAPARSEPAPATKAAPAAPAFAAGWYAQVGSFSQPANADGLRERVSQAGFSAHLQESATGKGTAYRVLVGPEPSREQAEKLLARLDKALKIWGIVIEIDAAAE